MSIKAGLDLKTRFVLGKKKHITVSKISPTFAQCPLSVGSYFFASDNFQGTFADFRFMMFTQVLMKELARIID